MNRRELLVEAFDNINLKSFHRKYLINDCQYPYLSSALKGNFTISHKLFHKCYEALNQFRSDINSKINEIEQQLDK